MKYRELGKTGLRVSELSYGAAELGGIYGEYAEENGIRAVHTAIELGMNLIDVAPYYGRTRAETVLGKALKGIPRERYYLSTKVGRYDLNEFDFSAERVKASVDESLERLGLDSIDLIICHDIEFVDMEQIVRDTLPALEQVRAEGKVRFIGVSGLPLKIYKYVLDRTPLDFILSYCHYGVLDNALEDLIPYLQAKEVGIINASSTSMGLITPHGPPPWHPASPEIKAVCAQAVAYCHAEGINPVQLTLQYALANPAIATTVVGSADPREIEKDVAWVDEPVDSIALGAVERILGPVHNQTWASGLPENN